MKIPYPSQCCSSSTCDAENWEISDISGQKQKLNGDSALSYFQFPLFPFAAGVGYLSPEICGEGLELGHRKQCKSLEFSFHSTPAHRLLLWLSIKPGDQAASISKAFLLKFLCFKTFEIKLGCWSEG